MYNYMIVYQPDSFFTSFIITLISIKIFIIAKISAARFEIDPNFKKSGTSKECYQTAGSIIGN